MEMQLGKRQGLTPASCRRRDDNIESDRNRDFGKGAWAAKKAGEAASVTGDLIEEGAKEVAIGKGVGAAAGVAGAAYGASRLGWFSRIRNFLGFGGKAGIEINEARAAHMFRNAEGHKSDTLAN